MIIHRDCKYFRGDIPCTPHKEHNVHCDSCSYYTKIENKILIIKLGAIGDVIRTTCLIDKLNKEYNNSEIFWITHTPDILPAKINHRLKFDFSNVLLLQQIDWDLIINLDKEREACSLINTLTGRIKKGFKLENGNAAPINDDAIHKFNTGLFDDINLMNKKNYQREIFEICGYSFNNEEYIIDIPVQKNGWEINNNKKVIGLNTGCGGRWTSRLWPENYWAELAKMLIENDYEVILLGGEQEHDKNTRISELSGAKYFGYYNLDTFINLMNQCALIVSAVTMAMHIAIGLKKNLLLFNNIFNPFEFELYNRGEIISPAEKCKCFYKAACTEEVHCMLTISPEFVLKKCIEWINK